MPVKVATPLNNDIVKIVVPEGEKKALTDESAIISKTSSNA